MTAEILEMNPDEMGLVINNMLVTILLEIVLPEGRQMTFLGEGCA